MSTSPRSPPNSPLYEELDEDGLEKVPPPFISVSEVHRTHPAEHKSQGGLSDQSLIPNPPSS